MTQPTALFLADVIDADAASAAHHGAAAYELRRLHEEVERLSVDGIHSCHAECLRPVCRLTRERDALLEALKEIAADYADRFDLDSPSTNPGIKFTIKQARAAIKQAEGENT